MSSNFQIRQNQIDALNAIHEEFKTSRVALLYAIMSFGKTVLTARMINAYWKSKPGAKFVVLAHRSDLVLQFEKAFLTKTDIPRSEIGICCAGLGKKQTKKRLTIATIQSYVGNISDAALLVIDECHLVSIGGGSQYDKVINAMWEINPEMRILGLSATPFRLGWGYCYGDKCKDGGVNLFPRVTHRVTYKDMKDQGFLMPLHGKVAMDGSMGKDLSMVTTNGDYVLSQLGDVMAKEIHIHTAKEAIDKYCVGYKCICVFACTIAHAEALVEAIGSEATIVHSKLSRKSRDRNMDDWKSGRKRIMVSINVLTTGFDHPPLDCIVFARPTLSAALFLQAIGRVLRLHEGKDSAFLLDLTPNTDRFGLDLDNVRVDVPRSVKDKEQKGMVKQCPNCKAEVHTALRMCECGYSWDAAKCIVAGVLPELQDVAFDTVKPEWKTITGFRCCRHTSKESGKELGRVILEYGENLYKPKTISIWLCFQDYYEGGAVKAAMEKWGQLSTDIFPESVDEFMFLSNTITPPTEVLVDESGKWPNAISFKWEEVPF